MTHAGQHHIGMRADDGLAHRAIADDDHACVGTLAADGGERAQGEAEVLLRRQPADADHRQAVRFHAPLPAQRRAAAGGRVQRGVDPARDHLYALVALGTQAACEFGRRHESRRSAVVETAQIGRHRLPQPADAVVAAVVVEVGVKVRGHRDAQLVGRRHRGPAQRTLGGHMHQVGTLARPFADQPGARGQPELEPVVARQLEAARQHLLERAGVQRGVGAGLARADQLHAVAAADQAIDHALERHRDAVDLGRPGLGHQRNAQTRRLAQLFGRVIERSHDAAA